MIHLFMTGWDLQIGRVRIKSRHIILGPMSHTIGHIQGNMLTLIITHRVIITHITITINIMFRQEIIVTSSQWKGREQVQNIRNTSGTKIQK